MGKIEQYRQYILSMFEERLHVKPINLQNVDNQIIVDTKHNHYQFVSTGWNGLIFSYAVLFHFDIKPDGKIWIQANNTDRDVAEELERMGVPKTDIVIGFQPPQYRALTGYAVA